MRMFLSQALSHVRLRPYWCEVCQEALPELRVGEFVDDEKAAAKRREMIVESFDPEI